MEISVERKERQVKRIERKKKKETRKEGNNGELPPDLPHKKGSRILLKLCTLKVHVKLFFF